MAMETDARRQSWEKQITRMEEGRWRWLAGSVKKDEGGLSDSSGKWDGVDALPWLLYNYGLQRPFTGV